MLNRKYWNSIHLKLLKQINNSDWNEKEKKSKKEKLNRLFKKMLEKEMLNNEYISLAHEIKSYDFLKLFGKVHKANDSKSQAGPDFTVGDYRIECVACSPGKTEDMLEKYQLTEYRKSIVSDYRKLLEILLPRITSSFGEKVNKFNSYLESGNVKNDEK